MKVFFINCNGGGFAAEIEVPNGMTLGGLFADKLPGCHPGDYLIRLNRAPAASEEVLTEGSRISITPRKIDGATSPPETPATVMTTFFEPAGEPPAGSFFA